MQDQEIQSELDTLQATLVAVRAAILALVGGAVSTTLTTGQNTLQVTRSSLSQLKTYERELRTDVANLQRQLRGGGLVIGRPAF